MKFHIWTFRKRSREIQVLLKSDNNKGNSTVELLIDDRESTDKMKENWRTWKGNLLGVFIQVSDQ